MKCEYENAVHKIIELANIIDNRKNAMWVNGKLDKRVKGRLLTIGKILNAEVATGENNCNLDVVSVSLPDDYVPFTTTEEFNKKLGEFLSGNER